MHTFRHDNGCVDEDNRRVGAVPRDRPSSPRAGLVRNLQFVIWLLFGACPDSVEILVESIGMPYVEDPASQIGNEGIGISWLLVIDHTPSSPVGWC